MNGDTEDREDVTVFWDFETTPSLSSVAAISTYEMVKNIRSAVATYGPLKSIRLYWDYGSHPFPSTTLRIRSEFSACGVNLVDCPSEGRKGAAIKKMLVDMLFHAWDSSLPPTFVVITGDRDVAYALAMLRMKSFRIVLISPAGSHPELSSQASIQLDWSSTILGINGGSNENGLFPKDSRIPLAHAPARSSKPGQESFQPELPCATLRDRPAPPLKPSVFSSPYDQGLNVFGGPRFASPKSSLGLGDPLFPHPQTANQKPLRSRSGSLNELLTPTSSANKGKNKASGPEDIELHPPPPSSRSRLWSSSSIFGQFDDEEFPIPRGSPAAAAEPERAVSSNSSGSRESRFSFEQISQVNTAEPVRLSNESGAAAVASVAAANQLATTPVAHSRLDATSGFQQTETLPLPLTPLPPPPVVTPAKAPPQTPKASTSQKKSVQLPRAVGTPKQTKSKPLPPAWVPLIETLRKHNGILSKPTLGPKLLKSYPDAFKLAGVKTIKPYLDAAMKAGIVFKHSWADAPYEIHLQPSYFS